MNIALSTQDPLKAPVDLLGVLCHEGALAEDALVQAVDKALGGAVMKAFERERFRGKAGQSVAITTLKSGGLAAERVVFLGAGPAAAFKPGDAKVVAGRLSRMGATSGAASAALASSKTADSATVQAAAEGLLLGAYRFDKYLSEDKRTPNPLASVTLHVGVADDPAALNRARHTAASVARARDLINEPAAYMTPSRMADVAREVAAEGGLAIEVLDREACRARGMGMFLAVAQGSAEEPKFIHLTWKPAGAKKRICLVGKGVTFDSGGLSLKPNDGMLDMKVDMSGAAAVISAMQAIAAEKLPVEVHAIAACTENMPGGRAYKLGDVLRSAAGKTVEINNTDAEGRLTLGDALHFALGLKPDAIFDFATLTGACVVALGPHTAGVMSNDETLRTNWLAAAHAAGEEMWPLPLPERLSEMLKSEVADMRNTGERWGGALTAGLFLKEFVGTTPWVHTDIAGPATADKDWGHVGKGGVGFAVASILEYLRQAAA